MNSLRTFGLDINKLRRFAGNDGKDGGRGDGHGERGCSSAICGTSSLLSSRFAIDEDTP